MANISFTGKVGTGYIVRFSGEVPDGAFMAGDSALDKCPANYHKSRSTFTGSYTDKLGITRSASASKYICVPIPQQQAPAAVTVSPTIQTQVSPQVSPVFQQQFQPTNSPATAGTAQTSAPPVSAPPQAAVSAPPQAAVPVAPVYTAPQTVPQYSAPAITEAPQAAIPGGGASIPVQMPVDTGDALPVQTSVSAPAPQPAQDSGFDWKIVAIMGATLVGALALTSNRKR